MKLISIVLMSFFAATFLSMASPAVKAYANNSGSIIIAESFLPVDGVAPDPGTTQPPSNNGKCIEPSCKDIDKLIIKLINILSATVAVAVVGSIVFAGIQYIMAADSPEKLSAAKKRIRTAIITLLAYIFFYAFMSWLVPGGIFS